MKKGIIVMVTIAICAFTAGNTYAGPHAHHMHHGHHHRHHAGHHGHKHATPAQTPSVSLPQSAPASSK